MGNVGSPPSKHNTSAGAWFVARERELESLRAALDRGLGGNVGLTLVVGEAGIGKTALADRLVAEARGRSVRVVRGDAEPGGRSPYGLWAGVRQALRLASSDDRALPPAERRWEQLDLLAEGIARAAPVLIVLDDLHWADDLSLWVLERLPHELTGRPVALVATARPDDVMARPDLPVRPAEVLPLSGLAEAELGQLLGLLGAPPGFDVAAVQERTGGNPLFVREVVAAGMDAGLPPVVGDLLTRSLRRLQPPVREALATFALAGPEAPLAVVASALDCSAPELRARLDEAVAGGFVLEGPGGRCYFRHSLLADAAVAMLPAPHQRRVHRTLAVLWETTVGGQEATTRAALHRLEAVPLEDPGTAAEAARAAAQAFIECGDVPGAASLLTTASEVLAAAGPRLTHQLARILVDLGEARFSLGDTAVATEVFERAAGLASGLDDAELLAAAEGGAARVVEFCGVDPVRIRRLATAEARLPTGDHPLRAILLGRLAVMAVGDSSLREKGYELGDEAVAMARRLGDGVLLAGALADRHLGPSRLQDLDARALASDELVALGERLGRPEIGLLGYEWQFAARLERGDLAGACDALARLEAWAAVMPSATWRYTALLRRALVHNLEGDRQAALQLIERATSTGRGVRPDFEVIGLDFASRLATARLWGQPDPALDPSLAEAARASAGRRAPFVQIPIALGYVAVGQVPAARRILERVCPEDVLHGPEGMTALSWLGALVADLGARDRASEILSLLEDGAGRLPLANGLVAELPVDAIRGRLTLLLGEAAAVDHLEAALALVRRMPAPPLEARCLYHLGEALARRGDAKGATVVAGEATALAEQLGLALPANPWVTTPGVAVGSAGRDVSLRRSGDHWVIASPFGTGEVPDSVGMAQLARLVGSPGAEVPATALAMGDSAPAPAADLGPVLDARAKRAYRARLSELQSEIDEADAFADLERASRARWEMDALVAELRRAVGLRGRDRPSGSGAERARVNVTRSLRRAVAAVSESIPALGSHLAVSVRTGRYCSYAPESAAALRWKVST